MPVGPRVLAAAAILVTNGASAASGGPRDVTIEARHYAYVVPATAPAGPTVFHFANRGRVAHEVQFFRFNPKHR